MRFKQYLRARYAALWVNTLEPARAEADLAQLALDVQETPPYRWNIRDGLTNLVTGATEAVASPVQAVARATELPANTVVFLWNYHKFITSTEVIQQIQNAIPRLKDAGSCIVVLAPSDDSLPAELARVFATLDFELPNREALARVACNLVEAQENGSSPDGLEPVVDAALGLTETEAEDALALALRPDGSFDISTIANEKASALLRQTQLQLNRYNERFSDLGGLERLKQYTLATAPHDLSLGILILGPPGTGKSHFAKALGNELGVPTLELDFGRLMGSLVGESEARVRAALAAIDAMGRCVVFLDEIEKGLAGVKSSGMTDSGVKAGVGATFLKWLSDREPGCAYVVATSNDVSSLPPEFQRAERWDSTWFIDLPNEVERAVIWKLYIDKYELGNPNLEAVPDDGWTGAEIKACCRTAAMMGVSIKKAADYVVPITRSMKEEISSLREWAKGRALQASYPATPRIGRTTRGKGRVIRKK